MPRFTYSSVVEAPVEVVFRLYEEPEALALLTPPWQPIQIVRREGGIQDGGVVELRLLFGPLKFKWVARHTGYEKNRQFSDEQVEGPFRHWVHRREFSAEDGMTRVSDVIDFSLPGGPLLDIWAAWLMRLQLKRLFGYRHRVTKRVCERRYRELAAKGAL